MKSERQGCRVEAIHIVSSHPARRTITSYTPGPSCVVRGSGVE